MMFRSLFFAAPLLVAGEVEEQSVLLQLKGRSETQELLQRATADMSEQTLRNLEQNLMSKGGKKVATAKCAFYMKTPQAAYGAKTPCEVLDVLEELYEDSLDEFEDFGKIGKKAVDEIMKHVKTSIKSFPDEAVNHTFSHTAESLALSETKFFKALEKAANKELGGNVTDYGLAILDGMEGIEEAVQDAFEEIFVPVQDNIKAVLANETVDSITLEDNTTFVPADAIAAILKNKNGDAEKMFKKVAENGLAVFENTVGASVAGFWKYLLDTPELKEDPLDIDWSSKKEVGKAEKAFWILSSGFLDGVDGNVEPVCTSEGFDAKKPGLKTACKGGKKPKCIDELMYRELDPHAEDGICDFVAEFPRKFRGKKFTDAKFIAHCNVTKDGEDSACKTRFLDADAPWTACRRANDVKKGCKMVTKFEKAEERRAAKAAKKALKAYKKTCYKDCKKEARSERRACKKVCKAITKVPEPEAEEEATEEAAEDTVDDTAE